MSANKTVGGESQMMTSCLFKNVAATSSHLLYAADKNEHWE